MDAYAAYDTNWKRTVVHLVIQVERETIRIWKLFQNALHCQTATEGVTEVNVLDAKERRCRREDFLEGLNRVHLKKV